MVKSFWSYCGSYECALVQALLNSKSVLAKSVASSNSSIRIISTSSQKLVIYDSQFSSMTLASWICLVTHSSKRGANGAGLTICPHQITLAFDFVFVKFTHFVHICYHLICMLITVPLTQNVIESAHKNTCK